jgi:hypothetical protein
LFIFYLGLQACERAAVSEARGEHREHAFPAYSNNCHQSLVVMVKGKIGDSSTDGVVVRGAPNSGVVELPLLSKGSYQEWALVMQVSLEALELWEVVEAEGKDQRFFVAFHRR